MPSIYELDHPHAPQRSYARLEPGIPTGDRLRERRDRLGPWASASPADRFVPAPPPVRQIVTEEVDTPFGRSEVIVDTQVPGAGQAAQPLTPPLSPVRNSPPTQAGGLFLPTPLGTPPAIELDGDVLFDGDGPWPEDLPHPEASPRPPLMPPVTVAMEEIEEAVVAPRQFTRRRLLGERRPPRPTALAAPQLLWPRPRTRCRSATTTAGLRTQRPHGRCAPSPQLAR